MLKRKGKKDVQAEVAAENKMLEIDASMQGALTFKDPVNIMIKGNFDGTLDTKGSLVIGEDATVKAQIKGEEVVVMGEVIGDVTVSKSLTLHEDARLIGDIQTPILAMENGAVLQGQVNMITSTDSKSTRDRSKSTFFNVEELASYLSIEKSLIFEWADSGKLPAVREGSSWRFDKKKVDEWVASGMIK